MRKQTKTNTEKPKINKPSAKCPEDVGAPPKNKLKPPLLNTLSTNKSRKAPTKKEEMHLLTKASMLI
jgi:hypothetical protein